MDYFTKLSATLDVGDAANRAVAMAMFERMERGLAPVAPEGQTDEKVEEIEDNLGFLGFSVEDRAGDGLWIHEDSNLEVSNVIEFVLACARRFSLTGLWTTQFSHDASKPTTEAYGGGYIVLDLGKAEEVAYGDTTMDCARIGEGYAALSDGPEGRPWIADAADAAKAAAMAQDPALTALELGWIRLGVAAALSLARDERQRP